MANANQATVYLKCDRNVEVQRQDVFISDLGNLRCADKQVSAKCRALKAHHFTKEGAKRCVISVLKLVELMEDACPGVSVDIVGETDVLVEWVQTSKRKGWRQGLKAAVVCFVSFFGTAFSIMAYHNDVGINDIFTEVYRMLMNREPGGLNMLETSYSIGLALGITVFFNHIGGQRLTKDPTPLEVAMRKYEQDVDTTLIETAGREGKEEEKAADSGSLGKEV